MLHIVDKKDVFQDRYQALIMPVPVSGIFRHRTLLHFQQIYPEHYLVYKQACEQSQLPLGDILLYETQQDLAGLGVSRALSKPKFIIDMAITEFAENRPHLRYIDMCLQKIQPLLFNWGRFGGIRRIAILASDELLLPKDTLFDDILPLLEKYLQPINHLNVLVYR